MARRDPLYTEAPPPRPARTTYSTHVERGGEVFGMARTTFGHERNNLYPITLEQILFLRQNASYWDEHTVDSLRS
ncbi:hypothetical protein GQ600_10901 [Phytophthora cactorum]|nr:hypothetical protein GQ600_10901 [Phytophthora cactorum]